jgi:metallo-beta-lactamase class B
MLTFRTIRRAAARPLLCIALSASLMLLPERAQNSAQNSAEAQKHIDAAKKIAGTDWAFAAQFFCSNEQQIAAMHILPSATQNDPEDAQRAEPMKVFDNLYFVGTKQVTTWIITTPDGYIAIDSGYAGKEESTMIAGMKKLDLDPAKIKDVLITHGHSDHYGGALYLHNHYGAHVYMSAPDWDLIEPKPGAKQEGGQGGPQPKRDMIVVDAQPIVLGGEQVTPILIPGHTPGALAVVFPVTDNGKRHIAALFGGTILSPADRFPASQFEQYLNSIRHFKDITQQMKVDVELENHPIMDGTFEKMANLKMRKPGEPNPFVVGQAKFQKFVDVMAECAEAQIARHGGNTHTAGA